MEEYVLIFDSKPPKNIIKAMRRMQKELPIVKLTQAPGHRFRFTATPETALTIKQMWGIAFRKKRVELLDPIIPGFLTCSGKGDTINIDLTHI